MENKVMDIVNQIIGHARECGIEMIVRTPNYVGCTDGYRIVAGETNLTKIDIDSIEAEVDEYRESKIPDFNDLYKYIQSADRDHYGYHYPSNIPGIAMHIYNGAQQVNICTVGEDHELPTVIGDIVFSNDNGDELMVKMVHVSMGRANYDGDYKWIPASTHVDDSKPTHWQLPFGTNGTFIKNFLIELLTPIVEAQQM